MRGTLPHRIFVLLAVIAVVGGPWLQVARGFAGPCPMSAMTTTADMGTGQAVPCDMPAHEDDAGKTMLPACAQDCAVQTNIVMPAIDFGTSSRVRASFDQDVFPTLRGHPPDPELSPPRTLI